MSAPAYGYMNHYCAIAEARGKMPCGDQCDECRIHEQTDEDESIMPIPRPEK